MAEIIHTGTLSRSIEKKLTMAKSRFIRRGNDTTIASIICGVVFCIFAFTFLYFYQSDLLTMEQHVLSNGLTHYNRLVGAIILTLLLQMLQFGIDTATCRYTKHPSITYFIPTMLIAIFTDISPQVDKGYTIGNWVWAAPLLLLVYTAITYVSASLLANTEGPNHKSVFRILWENLLIMAVLITFACMASNTDKTFHQRMKIEKLISEAKYTDALSVGKRNAETDSSTTMLRAYALSRTGLMGEKLFEYSLIGGSDAMLPNGKSVKTMLYSDTRIFNNVARVMKQATRPIKYMEWMRSHGYAKKALNDYLLCGYLMDKEIDKFARCLVGDPRYKHNCLPKHYKEAMVLYNHIRSTPIANYKNSVAEADYQDLQTIIKNTSDKAKQKALIQEAYGITYWYYWLYGKK